MKVSTLLFLSHVLLFVDGLIVDLKPTKIRKWNYITHFAFKELTGEMNFRIDFPKYLNGNQTTATFDLNPKLVLVTDNHEKWRKYYKQNYDNDNVRCEDELDSLIKFNFTYVFNIRNYQKSVTETIDFYSITSNEISVKLDDSYLYTFVNVFICDLDSKVLMKDTYTGRFEFTQGEPSRKFRYHLSADHFYILETLIFLIFAYLFLIIFAFVYQSKMLKHKRFTFFNVLIFIVITIKLQVFVIELILMALYSKNGTFYYIGIVIMEFFNYISIIIFIQILLSLAVGLTIKCGKLSYALILTIIIQSLCFFLFNLLATIFTLVKYNDAYSVYMYGDIYGYFIVAIQFIQAIEFVAGCIWMLVKFEDTRTFYFIYLIVCGLWIVSMPILILVANTALVEYLKFSVVLITRDILDVVGNFAFLILTYPDISKSLVVYTTPPHVIQATKFEDMVNSTAQESPKTLTQHNVEFLNINDFII